jgi:uncharacterized membrane protein
VQWVLRLGLALACVLIGVGLVMALAMGERMAAPVHLHEVLSEGTMADRVIASGLLLLAMTPVIRVLSLVGIWTYERDRKFVIVALIVVAVLGVAIASGRG